MPKNTLFQLLEADHVWYCDFDCSSTKIETVSIWRIYFRNKWIDDNYTKYDDAGILFVTYVV